MLDNVIFNGNTAGDLLWLAGYLALTIGIANVTPVLFKGGA